MATTLVNLGEEWVVDRLVGSGTYSTYTGAYVGWGTASRAESKTHTGLGGESTDPGSASRTSGTVSKTGTGSTAKWQNVNTIASTTTQTINEAGVFSAAGSATMFVEGSFTGIALSSGDSIQFTFTLDPA